MYENTQVAVVILVAVGLVFLALLPVALSEANSYPVWIVVGILGVVAFLFHSLTVRVQDAKLEIRFGTGLIGRTIPLQRIRDVRAVTNPWWYGYGIRYTPSGWLYNVSGRGAVKVALDGGSSILVGTNEPDRLVAAIRRGLEMSRSRG